MTDKIVFMTRREIIRFLTTLSRTRVLNNTEFNNISNMINNENSKITFLKENSNYNYMLIIPKDYYQEFVSFCSKNNCIVSEARQVNYKIEESLVLCNDIIDKIINENDTDFIKNIEENKDVKDLFTIMSLINNALFGIDNELNNNL